MPYTVGPLSDPSVAQQIGTWVDEFLRQRLNLAPEESIAAGVGRVMGKLQGLSAAAQAAALPQPGASGTGFINLVSTTANGVPLEHEGGEESSSSQAPLS